MIHLSGEKFVQDTGSVNLKKRRRMSFDILSDPLPTCTDCTLEFKTMCLNDSTLFLAKFLHLVQW